MREAAYLVDGGRVKRLGSTTVPQIMASGVSAYLGGLLGLGNMVTTNSSACTTGTESILLAYEQVANGYAERMLAGSASDSGPYLWGGFDAMRVMNNRSNDQPEVASRPLSATAAGFVPGKWGPVPCYLSRWKLPRPAVPKSMPRYWAEPATPADSAMGVR
jgi:3-oxoacyl-[acyl-carrier-protein] synthase-1